MSIKKSALRYFFKIIGKANVERLRKKISFVYAIIENFNYDASTNGEHWLLLNLIAGRCSAYMDVGANVGEYSIFIAKNSRHIDNLSIISVEPSPYTFDLLMSNVEPFDSIKPFNLALSDANGAKVFYEYDDGSGRNTLEGETTGIKYKKSYNLEVKTAHDFLMENQITPRFDLVKIDVEGHELPVLKGATETIKKHKPTIAIEIHDFSEDSEIHQYLKSLGYGDPEPRPEDMFIYKSFA